MKVSELTPEQRASFKRRLEEYRRSIDEACASGEMGGPQGVMLWFAKVDDLKKEYGTEDVPT